MRAQITITDEDGLVLAGEVNLAPVKGTRISRNSGKRAPKIEAATRAPQVKVDFAKQERAFMKTHAEGLSGPKKFALVLAYLAKGSLGAEVPLKEVEAHWNRMTSLLGNFNRKYTNDAKELGWVDTKKKGLYVLTSSWKEAVEE